MIPFKKFINKIPKPVRKITGTALDLSLAPTIFNQGKKGSLTNQAMNQIDKFVGSKTMIKSNPEFIQDTDIGKKTGEYIAKKLKPQQIKGRKK